MRPALRARIGSNVAVGTLLGVLTALLFAPAFAGAGSEFDEGILVAFPTRVLQGDLPYRDFETFYGPAEPFVAAAVFRVFGSTLGAERAIGFAFRLLAVLAAFALLLPWGRTASFAGGIVAACVAAAGGVTFGSDIAAQALAIAAVALAWRAGRGSPWLLAAAGFVAGLAGLFRAELAVVTVLALVPILLARRRRSLVLGAVGFVVVLSPYVPLALAAGTSRLERNFHDLVATGSARRLPITAHGDPGHLLAGFAVALVVLALAAAASLRHGEPRAPLFCSITLFAGLQLPYALWRADAPHVATAGLLAFAALPAAASELVPRRAVAGAWLAGAAALALFAGVHYVRGGISRNAKLALGRTHASVVSYDGRDFRLDDAAAARSLQRAIDATARLAPRGGSLFVGPTDLRRTDGNDVFVYYLFPHLRPASFFVELDPPASKRSSGLARDLGRADVLLLGRRWNRETEPNGSRRFGSNAPNLVVRRLFCRRAGFGGYEVLTRCR
ncbi:MAG TPA: hypothetical protein VF101_17030 [Gaiellaceae bacterium]